MPPKSKFDKINEYRIQHLLSIRSMAAEIGIPYNVLRRAIQKKTSSVRDYHEARIDTWMKKHGLDH